MRAKFSEARLFNHTFSSEKSEQESWIGSCPIACAVSLVLDVIQPGAFVLISRGVYEFMSRRLGGPVLPTAVTCVHTGTELVSCFFSFNSVYIVEINWQ